MNLADEKSAESRAVLDKLENIDSETDNLDITFVKMQDPRYARKWGVTKLPAIVYFRKRFPSIYRGKILTKMQLLENVLCFLSRNIFIVKYSKRNIEKEQYKHL